MENEGVGPSVRPHLHRAGSGNVESISVNGPGDRWRPISKLPGTPKSDLDRCWYLTCRKQEERRARPRATGKAWRAAGRNRGEAIATWDDEAVPPSRWPFKEFESNDVCKQGGSDRRRQEE
jgi:hypothetical protein